MTVAEFKAAFPPLAARSDDVIQAALDEAALFVDPSEEKWANFGNLALGNYAAHKIVFDAALTGVSTTTFDTSAVTSKTVGKVSKSAAAELIGRQFDEPLLTTIYGRKFVYYRNLAGKGAVGV